MQRITRAPLLATVLLLTACASDTTRRIIVTPQGQATIFINGEERGPADGMFELPFDESDRVYIQAVREGCYGALRIMTPNELPREDRAIELQLNPVQ